MILPTHPIDRLANALNGRTTEDDQLILSILLSAAASVRSPFFVITGAIASGKTRTAHLIAEIIQSAPMLCYGDFGDSLDRIKSRMVGAPSETRVVLFDNVTSISTQIADLACQDQIVGHKLHVGEVAIPNRFIYIATGNAIRMSEDVVERVVHIGMGDSTENNQPDPFGHPFTYTDEIRRWVADVMSVMPTEVKPSGRWYDWMQVVLGRFGVKGQTLIDSVLAGQTLRAPA